jgi:hypothetical protein
VQLHGKLAAERKREADKQSRIGQVERSITKNTSMSSVKSKLSEIERLNKDIEQTKKKQAELSKKIADKEKKKHEHERDLLKEQGREQKALQKQQEQRLAQYRAELRNALSASTIRSGVVTGGATEPAKEHDVFISHASEDKDGFVRGLAEGLRERGVDVWYDEFELKVGDSLRRSIDKGLANSRFGIVVLSSAFFAKNWTEYELDGLVAKENAAGDKVILPIWHKVSKDEVMKQSPTLGDRVALNTGIQGLDEIIDQLVDVVRPTATNTPEIVVRDAATKAKETLS